MTTKKAAAPAAKTETETEDNKVAPADTFDTAGPPQQIVPDVDPSHPAVDADPRAGTSVDQNRIDFNDPTLTGPEAVEENLNKG